MSEPSDAAAPPETPDAIRPRERLGPYNCWYRVVDNVIQNRAGTGGEWVSIVDEGYRIVADLLANPVEAAPHTPSVPPRETANEDDVDVRSVLARVFDDGVDVAYDEWRAYYQPDAWLSCERALGAFIRQRLLLSQTFPDAAEGCEVPRRAEDSTRGCAELCERDSIEGPVGPGEVEAVEAPS